MPHIILQPASGSAAYQHLTDTIENPVPFSRMEQFLPRTDLDRLRASYVDDAAPIWGVTRGKGDSNLPSYDRIEEGDTVAFARAGELFALATIAYKFRSKRLAEALWGSDSAGLTWECMYAVDEYRRVSIPYSDFNRAVGYRSNFIPRGFSTLDDQKSARFFAYIGLDTTRHPSPVDPEDYAAAVRLPEGETDLLISTTRRLEQSYLRAALVDGPTANCGVCGRSFDSEFLIAAHIKRRAACSEEERRDVPSVAMPACMFGCDALFEMGFVTVAEGGNWSISPRLDPRTPSYEYASQHIGGRKCDLYTDGRIKYFIWHRQQVFRA